ncbi:thioredoxin-dependent thiol peroxidase [Cohnella sp. REN36]|uniref:thioredoxin-dependent thiol peroxidase n=1 Tax=Cohnella sp. REN36 TaxID=2887347 RepID=UPI001D151EEB|nr:thioredoxin-dependent thiol peroxidase [Cohnella sp. REN36]MCC3376425.1 thioredoxin-dependent thiol peroxidase [Cohnella sp. REN36]
MTTPLTIGAPAPDFALAASNGKTVSLSQYRGRKVVIYFYPQDDTPTCTQQSCDFRDAVPDFDKTGAVVLGISPDDLKSHRKFADKFGLPFLLLSDPDHAIAEQYGVWQMKKLYGREYMGIVRSTFLIDEAGILRQEWRNIRVKGHIAKVLEAAKKT